MTPASPTQSPLPPHLTQALERAGWVLFWERLRQRAWIPASILLLFIAFGASGLLSRLPSEAHLAALAAFALSLAASLLYPDGGLLRLRFPTQHEQARRLEEQNALAHRPLRDWQDSPIGGDPTLWREHRRRQLAALPSRLYAGEPRPALAGRDRYALRAAALLLALAALGITAAPFEELRRAISPFAAEAAGPTQLEIWLEPPTYTGRAPLYPDAAGAAFRPTETPQHSELVIRLQDTGGEPLLRLHSTGAAKAENAPDSETFTPLEDGRLEFRAILEADSEVTLALPGEETPRRWRIAIVPDMPPRIAWNAPISFTYSGSLRVEYAAGDDYGITEAAALLERDFTEVENRNLPPPSARSPLAPTLLIVLPLRPSPDSDAHTEYHDLAAHPWAGLPVRMRLTAKDEAGQRRYSGTIAFQLPEVAFESPLARAFMEMRRRLALAPPVAAGAARTPREEERDSPAPPRTTPSEKGASLAPVTRLASLSNLALMDEEEEGSVGDALASLEGGASFGMPLRQVSDKKGGRAGKMIGGCGGLCPPHAKHMPNAGRGDVGGGGLPPAHPPPPAPHMQKPMLLASVDAGELPPPEGTAQKDDASFGIAVRNGSEQKEGNATHEGVASFALDVAASPGQKGRVGGQKQGGAWGGLPPKTKALALGESDAAPFGAPTPEAAAKKDDASFGIAVRNGSEQKEGNATHEGVASFAPDVAASPGQKGWVGGQKEWGVWGVSPHMQEPTHLASVDAGEIPPPEAAAQKGANNAEEGGSVGGTIPPHTNEIEWVIQALDALAKAPELYDLEASDYLHLRAAHWKLRVGATPQALKEARDLLWRMALRAEAGMLPDLEERLRAAREALERALTEEAPEREIQELLERFQSALNAYLREQARRDIARGQPSPLPNADSIDSRQLSDMLERIGELSGINAYEEARRLLSELAEILENLQFAAPTPEERAISRALQELQQIERQQQQLLDETHRQQQNCPPGETCPPPNAETARNLQALQQSLRDRLENMLSNMEADGVPAPDALQEGAQSMGESARDLGAGAFGDSTEPQGVALQRLREGFDELMRQGGGGGQGGGVTAGQGDGRGRSGGPGSDPLGRNLGDSLSDTEEDIVPREIDPQWAREMRADILRRLGESWRSRVERNYLERLLRQGDPVLPQ